MIHVFKNLFEKIKCPVFFVDTKGIVISVNEYGNTLFGYKKDELVGQNVNVLVPPPDKEKHDEYLKKYLETGKGNVIGIGRDVMAVKKDGRTIPVFLNISRLNIKDFDGFIGVILDSLELVDVQNKQATKTINKEYFLNKKTEELKAQVQQVSQFTHILCHDLLNPIGAVISLLEVQDMLGVKLTPLELKIKNHIETSINIIEDVKMLMAITEGKLKLKLDFFNLQKLIDKSFEILESKIKTKKIEFDVKIDPKIEILANKNSFVSTVFNNVLTNAMKFSPEGAKIEISMEQQQERLILKVRDFGIGMPKEILDNVFSNDIPTSRKGLSGEKGTGFGMPLIKRFMESLEGSIMVDSWDIKEHKEKSGTLIQLFLWCRIPK